MALLRALALVLLVLPCAAGAQRDAEQIIQELGKLAWQKGPSEGAIAGIRYYPYHGIAAALDDLEAGRIGLVIKLHPVISWLVKDRPDLAVAIEVPTHERLGIAFAKDNESLCQAVDRALTALRDTGELARLQARWFPPGP